MRATLIVNPHSGRGTARRVAGRVARMLRPVVGELHATVTPDAAATARAATVAVERGDDVLAVLGGDGTAHLAAQALAGSSTALAVIPAGTGNDLAAGLGVPLEPLAATEHVADAVRAGRRRRLDVGRIDGGAAYTTVLCSGFDAAVNARANALRWPRGPRRYEVAVLAELAALRPREVTVRTDSGELTAEATLVAVANSPSYGGGLRICPIADPSDGLLDVVLVAGLSRARLLRLFPLLRTGDHLDLPEVTVLRGRSVTVEGDPGWPVYADGEPQGTLPVTVHCEPGALTVVA